ncbi:hypothetical protein QTL97_04425 [Sporosarcina thermotolerans]|uniref:Uncharacterized protein n=1 Tax=Sporosarcina thermotolerans TaxID=633404 RepID=A0AAW9A596_9BACL|nr:hypothetical protein [Sporosarcina thermotolerans]MDW0116167.1 hypothetical protein [Sporosarcina thermotolerans]WHT48142.1 hypothetical protein QNH10_19290 [Sporosarcina thermotolerans]
MFIPKVAHAYRKENVPSVALLQNDCAVDGLKFTVLGNDLYFIEGNEIYYVNWNEGKSEKTLIYESDRPLRHLTSNNHFIAVIEEGSGLVFFDSENKSRMYSFEGIKEHYSFWDKVILYNEDQDVYFVNIDEDMSGYYLTADKPITQLIQDEQMVVVQLEEPHFHNASKLLYHELADVTELVGKEVKFVADFLSSKVVQEEDSKFIRTDAMDALDYGNYGKAWSELQQESIEVLSYYHEDDHHFGCFYEEDEYRIALLDDSFKHITKLEVERVPDWFAVIGQLVVYYDGEVKWTKIAA